MKNKLMTHVVAGYPSKTDCLTLLLGMQEAGVHAIEIQIPFTDPSADGPTIMRANDIALANGMNIDTCFKLINKARRQGLKTPVYVMSYANKLFHYGFKNFCDQARRCNAQGLIIPDLPFDTKEYQELLGYSKAANIELVPVLSPGVLGDRLNGHDLAKQKLIYVTSTRGITGKELTVSAELTKLIKQIRLISDAEVALGFGITKLQDVTEALKIADIAVIGSEVIRVVDKQGMGSAKKFIKKLINSQGEKI